jgi:nucleoside-diphosphate-sugar epimerase
MSKKSVLIVGYPGWLSNYLVKFLTKGSEDYPEYKPKYAMQIMMYDKCKLDLYQLVKDLNDDIVVGFGDILNYNDCLMATKNVDVVVHIAGIIHPKKVKTFYDINVKGTDNMVRASIANGVKKFIYISSNGACGVRDYAMTEMTPDIPYMHYGKSKKLAEELILEHSFTSDMKCIILRPCWFYGEGQPDRQNKLFKMIKKGKPMIFGKGTNYRSMSYVGNTSHAIQKAIDYNQELSYETYWIADENAYTTNEIYNTIAKLFDVKLKPRYIPAISCTVGRLGDTILQKLGRYNQYIHVLGEMDRNIECDIAYAKQKLGYNPKVTLVEGMGRSIKWCIDNDKL